MVRDREEAQDKVTEVASIQENNTQRDTLCLAKRAVFYKAQGREQKEGRQHEIRMTETVTETEQRNKVES